MNCTLRSDILDVSYRFIRVGRWEKVTGVFRIDIQFQFKYLNYIYFNLLTTTMDKVINTFFIDGGKSTYTITCHQTNSNKRYVSILQVIHNANGNEESRQVIKIADQFIMKFIDTLIQTRSRNEKVLMITKNIKYNNTDKIISRYLKGVNINDLALQFDCKESLIKDILITNNIEVVENQLKPPKPLFRNRYKRKR